MMFFAAIALLLGQVPETDGSLPVLTVEVSGFERFSGDALMAVFASGEDFPRETDEAVYKAMKPVESATVVFAIDSLPPGVYAIYVYHDEDGDRELDMHWYGPPSEKVGVSNNATGFAGPPSFDDAAFELGEEPLVLEIQLQ